jgi:TPR repeat protein
MPTAQFALGRMLMEGKGVVRDDAAAMQWLSLAHVNGSKRAEDYIKTLLKRMDPAEVRAIRDRMTENAKSAG